MLDLHIISIALSVALTFKACLTTIHYLVSGFGMSFNYICPFGLSRGTLQLHPGLCTKRASYSFSWTHTPPLFEICPFGLSFGTIQLHPSYFSSLLSISVLSSWCLSTISSAPCTSFASSSDPNSVQVSADQASCRCVRWGGGGGGGWQGWAFKDN